MDNLVLITLKGSFSPQQGWPLFRNVLISKPVPTTLNVPKSLHQSPVAYSLAA
jgi:hypothetical protein